jgi:zinc protease
MSNACRLALLAAVLAGSAASCTPENPKTSFSHSEFRFRLDNGLRAVIMPDPSTTQIEVDVRYEVGSREDPPGKAGLAHLVEHMMFQQRPDGPESPALMHSIDQLTTFFNAYTSWDTTHYMLAGRGDVPDPKKPGEVKPGQLDAFLKIESMRMFFRCQTISEEEFLREREVVRNEIRQRGGTAEGRIPDLILAEVYPKGHAYGRMIGGDDTNLTSITMKDVCDFMDKYYVPERATVIVAGGVDPEKTRKMIAQWFAPLPKKPAGKRVEVAPVMAVTKGRAEYKLDIERPHLVVAWPLPASNTAEGRALGFGLNRVFGGTALQASRYEFAYNVDATMLGGQEAPVFAMIIELKGADKIGEALEFVEKSTKQAHRGFDDIDWQSLEDYKAQSKASFLQNLESLMARTNALGDAIQFDNTIEFESTNDYLMGEFKRISEFDAGQIASSIKRYLDYDKAKIIVFKSDKAGIHGDRRAKVEFQTKSHDRRENPDIDPREAKVPLTVEADLGAFGKAERYTLGNGMKVVLLPNESPFPLVSALLMFNVGDAQSGDTPGLARVAAQRLSPPRDMDALARTGIDVWGSPSRDTTYVYSGGLDLYTSVIIKGMERTVKASEYSQEGIEAWQKRTREAFGRKDYQQEIEFDRQQLTALYGADHPYTRNGVLTPSSASDIGRDNLMAFKRAHYSAGNATLVVVGKFDPVKIKATISDTFGAWSKGRVDEPVSREPRERTGPEYVGVVGNEGPQMSVRIMYPAPAGIDGQEAARRVLTEMMNIRMGDIRYKLGSTYGTGAGRVVQMGPGAYTAAGDVDARRAGESLKAMREGIEMLRRGDNFDLDFVRARRKLIEDLLGQSTVSSAMTQRLAQMARFDLPPDYYTKLIKLIAATSPAQVKALIAKELDPTKEIIVCLGDRPTLEKAFAEAGVAQVKLVEPDYR